MNNKPYRNIEFPFIPTIKETVYKLQECHEAGMRVSTEFNGVTLFSDTVTLDSAYLAITGKTYKEFRQYEADMQAERNRVEQEHIAKIPKLTEEWIEKGNKILSEDKRKLWADVVPIRLSDLYQGMELGNCLDIVEVLNTGGTLDEARKVLASQDHSGMSHSLVISMVGSFADRGKEFFEHMQKRGF